MIDTGIAEEIIANTVTDEFNKVLEVQQSKNKILVFILPFNTC